MDSRTVNKKIRAEIGPVLRESGFSHSTGRTSWRHGNREIDVVNFQSFSAYNAAVIGCTTYSFAVNLGCYLLEVPDNRGRIKSKGQMVLPQEFNCHLRGGLRRRIDQPEFSRRGIWYIDPDGVYLEKAIQDVRMALLRDAFPWFARLHDRHEVLRVLLEQQEDMSLLWGFGNPGSPLRQRLTGYVALALGRNDLAYRSLMFAASTSSYASEAEDLRQAGAKAIDSRSATAQSDHDA